MLAAVWTVLAVAAAADWWSRWGDARRVEAVAKPLATAAAGALALAVGGAPGAGRALASVAFACCLAGDVALLPQVDRFVAGLAAFLLGHVAFVAMFVALGLGRPWWSVVALPVAAAMAATVGRRIVAGARRREPALAVPVVAYLVVILTMGVVAAATGRATAIAGAALFVASDALLGWGRFVGARRWTPLAVMVTYHGALVGLALSLDRAAGVR